MTKNFKISAYCGGCRGMKTKYAETQEQADAIAEDFTRRYKPKNGAKIEDLR